VALSRASFESGRHRTRAQGFLLVPARCSAPLIDVRFPGAAPMARLRQPGWALVEDRGPGGCGARRGDLSRRAGTGLHGAHRVRNRLWKRFGIACIGNGENWLRMCDKGCCNVQQAGRVGREDELNSVAMLMYQRQRNKQAHATSGLSARKNTCTIKHCRFDHSPRAHKSSSS
jgi:hypothetical protein